MNKQMSSALAQGDQTPVECIGKGERVLTVKEVEFLGDDLLVVKDEIENKVYTGVGYICRGIGFSKSQKDTQVQNIQNDLVLREGCLKFQAGVIDPNNDVLAIDIDYLPLWLAKISITPKMKEQQPELVDKLVNYQLKVKDVLASVFVHNIDLLEGVSPELKAILMQDKKLQVVEKRVDKLENTMTIDYGQQEDLRLQVAKRVIYLTGGTDMEAYKNFKVRDKVFREIYRHLKHGFNVNSYRNIAVKDYQRALAEAKSYEVSEELYLMIKGANSQMKLES